MTAAVARGPLVIFDIGETLVHGPAIGPAERLTTALGLASDPALSKLLMTTGFQGWETLAAALESQYSLRVGAANEAARRVWESQLEDARPIDGAYDTLHALATGGMQLALLSNIWEPYARAVRRSFGAVFDAAIPPELQCLSYKVGLVKPDPELFIGLLNRAHRPPRRAIMVGDSLAHDIVPAARIGLRTVLVGGQRPSGAVTPADITLGSVPEITADLVGKLCAEDEPADRRAEDACT